MKSFIVSVSILFVLIFGSIGFNYCLDKIDKEMLSSVDEITNAIERSDFEDANKMSKELSEYIDEKKPLLASILNHESIDNIEAEISDLLGYTEKSDLVEAIVSTKRLKHLFEHLPENYKLLFQNIL